MIARYVVQIFAIPELRKERLLRSFRDPQIWAFWFEIGHDHEGVVPKSLNLYRFPCPGCDGDAIDSRVHPGELFA